MAPARYLYGTAPRFVNPSLNIVAIVPTSPPAIAHTSSNLLLISCPAEDRRPSWPENAVGYGNLLKVACDRRPGGIGPMCVCVCVCVCSDNNF